MPGVSIVLHPDLVHPLTFYFSTSWPPCVIKKYIPLNEVKHARYA